MPLVRHSTRAIPTRIALFVLAARLFAAVVGLFQVNALVPAGVSPGDAALIALSVGAVKSPDGVTVAVQ